jgi:hypothetical protein
MSDALFGIIREFEGALEGQMRRQREENIQRKREFEKRFLEKELELAERENAWKKELQRREVCHAHSQWACSNLHIMVSLVSEGTKGSRGARRSTCAIKAGV